MKRFNFRTQQWTAWLLLIVITLVYIIEMSHQALLRYDTFKATAFDLGNMDQVLWNTIHGRLFQFTNQAIDWYGPPTRLALHFEPIILPLSLLYLFHADPRILLVFQTLALASGTLPVFLLTRKYVPEWPLLAVFMVLAYLLAPALLGANIFDFHPLTLAAPLLLYALLALTYKRYVWFLIACVLAASCKEDVPLTVALLGVLVIWRYKLPRLGTTLIIGGLIWSFLAFFVIIPHFYPGAQHNNFWYRYESLGSSPGAAVVNILLHPWVLFTTFITFDRFFYLAGLIRSSGFLALLAPEWLLPVLPSLAINLLSTDPLLYSGVYHYNAAIIPFVMLASIHGARRLFTFWQQCRSETNHVGGATQGSLVQLLQSPEPVEAGTLGSPMLSMQSSKPVGAGVERSGVGTLGSPTQPLQSLKQVEHDQYLPDGVTRRHPAWGAGNPLHSPSAPAPTGDGSLWRGFPKSLPLKALAEKAFKAIQTFLVSKARPLLAPVRRQWERFSARMTPLAKGIPVPRLQWVMFSWITLMIALNFISVTPALNALWADHNPGTREQHIQQLLAMIPPDASVSAGGNLNPHLSERQRLAVFPSPLNTSIQYIIVDLDAVFPQDRAAVTNELNQLVASGQFRELARAEGVVLLVRRSA